MTLRHTCLTLITLSLLASTSWAKPRGPLMPNGNRLDAQRQNYRLQQAQRMCLLCERTPVVREHLNLTGFDVQKMRTIVYGAQRYYRGKGEFNLRAAAARPLILREAGQQNQKLLALYSGNPQFSQFERLENFLGKQRFQRLQQLDWQSMIRGRTGYNYSYILFNDPDFVSMTGLSMQQRNLFYTKTKGGSNQIKRLYKEVATQIHQPGADLDKLKAKIRKAIKDLEVPVKDVLNKDQQRRLNAICGPHLPAAPWAEEGFAGFMNQNGSTAKIKMFFEQMIQQLEAKKKAAAKVGK